MIKVLVESKKISVLGHANYDEYGKDIVCAAVSATVITTINAILKIDETISYEEKQDAIIINVIKKDRITKILLDNMIDALKELEENYGKYIKIIFKEV